MKQLKHVFLVVMTATSMTAGLNAQDGFPSSIVFNRVILLNYADDTDQDAKNEILTLFERMRKRIDGCEWSSTSELSDSSQGFEQAVTLTFNSKNALDKYETHPDYLNFKVLSKKLLDDYATYDYWEKME